MRPYNPYDPHDRLDQPDDGGVGTKVSPVAAVLATLVLIGLRLAAGEVLPTDLLVPVNGFLYAVVGVVLGVMIRHPVYAAILASFAAVFILSQLDVAGGLNPVDLAAPIIGAAIVALVKSAKEDAKWEARIKKKR